MQQQFSLTSINVAFYIFMTAAATATAAYTSSVANDWTKEHSAYLLRVHAVLKLISCSLRIGTMLFKKSMGKSRRTGGQADRRTGGQANFVPNLPIK